MSNVPRELIKSCRRKKSFKDLLIARVLHFQSVVAELPVGVLEAVAPLQLQAVVVGVDTLAFGWGRRERSGVESRSGTEGTRSDTVNRLNSDCVGSIGTKSFKGVMCFGSGGGYDRRACVNIVVCDVFTV